VFSAIEAILLRPLSFPHGDDLVQLEQQNLKKKGAQGFAAPARLEDWNRDNSTFQAISGYYTQSISVRTGDLPEKVTEAFVSPRFLKVWGVEPMLGRDFTSAEQKFGGPGAVLVSERFWRTHLQGDPKAVGRPLGKGDPLTVVGVLPATFRFPDRDADL
jgi:putative ABC transport system permease protein